MRYKAIAILTLFFFLSNANGFNLDSLSDGSNEKTVEFLANATLYISLPKDAHISSAYFDIIPHPSYVSKEIEKELLFNQSLKENTVFENGSLKMKESNYSTSFDFVGEGENVVLGDGLSLSKTDEFVFKDSIKVDDAGYGQYRADIGFENGTVHAVWEDYRNIDFDIYYSFSNDGENFSKNIIVNDVQSGRQEMAKIFVFDGKINVVWADKRDGNYRIYYSSGLPFSKSYRVSEEIGYALLPSIAVDENLVHVVWEDYRNGRSQLYYANSKDGKIFSKNMIVNESIGEQKAPSIALDKKGNLHIVWYENRTGNFDIYYTVLENGVFSKSIRIDDSYLLPFPFNESAQYLPSIALDRNDIAHIVWHDYRDGKYSNIYYANVNKKIVSKNVIVNELEEGYHRGADISVKDGVANIVWFDDSSGNNEIYYTRAIDLSSFEKKKMVGKFTGEDKTFPKIEMSDEVHVLWEEKSDIYYGRGIKAYASSGSFTLDPNRIEASRYCNLKINATVPKDTKVSLYFRTSDDNETWNDWLLAKLDNLTCNLETKPKKYIQLKLLLETLNQILTPIIRGIELYYYAYAVHGYILYNLSSNDIVSTTIIYDGSYEDISLKVTNNGNLWHDITNSTMPFLFNETGNEFGLFIELFSLPYSSSTLSKLLVSYTTKAYPTNFKVFLDREKIFETSALRERTKIGDFSNAINRYGSNNIPINFFSTGKAKFEIKNISIFGNLPPIISELSPKKHITINETDNITFYIFLDDKDGDKIIYKWYIDSDFISSNEKYELKTNYSSSGMYKITCNATDGYFFVEEEWYINILDLDRAPLIIDFLPKDNLSLVKGDRETFSINAIDEDGDELKYQWYLDNKLVWVGNTYQLNTKELIGKHEIKVEVKANEQKVEKIWSIEVKESEKKSDMQKLYIYILIAGISAIIIFMIYVIKTKFQVRK